MVGVSSLEWGSSYPFYFGIAAFFFVLLSYNLQRYVRSLQPSEERTLSSRGLPLLAYVILILVSGIGAAFSFFVLDGEVLVALVPLALLSLFYALPVFGSGKGLRDLPYIKVFLIALSWAYLTVPVAALQLDVPLGRSEFGLFLERCLFVLAITLPFDIRDLEIDDPEERSLPQVFGVRVSKGIAILALALVAVLVLLRYAYGSLSPPLLGGYILTFLVAGGLIAGSHPQRPSLYYEGLLDGTMPLLYLAQLLLVTIL